MENTNELYHYGVKGMKWGVRRAKKRAERADRNIRRLENLRTNNKIDYREMDRSAREKYSNPKKAKKLNMALATNKARYDRSEMINQYAIANQKAKKDKNYKNSTEYIRAKNAYSKAYTTELLYGSEGSIRINALKSTGKSDKQAKGQVFAEQVLLGVGIGALSVAYTVAMDRL